MRVVALCMAAHRSCPALPCPALPCPALPCQYRPADSSEAHLAGSMLCYRGAFGLVVTHQATDCELFMLSPALAFEEAAQTPPIGAL